MRRAFYLSLCIGACLPLTPVNAQTMAFNDPVSAVLPSAPGNADPVMPIVGVLEHMLRSRYGSDHRLLRFYEQRAFSPVWFQAGVTLKSPRAFIEMLEQSGEHGLNAEYYDTALLRARQSTGDTDVGFEVLITDALLQYISDITFGRYKPEDFYVDITPEKDARDPVDTLHSLLKSDTPQASNAHPAPDDIGYTALKKGLAFYRGIDDEGGFSHMPEGKTIRPGDSDPRVPLLRVRLDQEKMAPAEAIDVALEEANIYDFNIADAVVVFQKTRGLAPDGVVGPATIAALNEPTRQLVDKITLSMERRRWLPRTLEDRRVMVNIAGFGVRGYDNGEQSFEMKAIVGEPLHETPVFSSVITDVIFHPYWYMPKRLREEVYLPKIIADPGYAVKKGYKIYPPSGRWTPLNPYTLIPGGSYRIRQDPGPHNALGKVKFPIRNNWSIYLHDTAAPQLFSKHARAFSSGCIRLEDPLKMSQFLLKYQSGYSDDRIASIYHAARGRKSQKQVKLSQPVRVHLLYRTSWADEDGVVHFSEDVYKKDRPLREFQREHYRISKLKRQKETAYLAHE